MFRDVPKVTHTPFEFNPAAFKYILFCLISALLLLLRIIISTIDYYV